MNWIFLFPLVRLERQGRVVKVMREKTTAQLTFLYSKISEKGIPQIPGVTAAVSKVKGKLEPLQEKSSFLLANLHLKSYSENVAIIICVSGWGEREDSSLSGWGRKFLKYCMREDESTSSFSNSRGDATRCSEKTRSVTELQNGAFPFALRPLGEGCFLTCQMILTAAESFKIFGGREREQDSTDKP